MSEIFKENEYEIDKILIKICYCFFAFYQLLFVSTLSFKTNLILVIVGVIISLIPILYYKSSSDRSKFKWITIIFLIINITIMYSAFYANVMLLWVIPIIVATMYSDRKLIICTILLIIPGLIIAEFFASTFKLEFIAETKWIIFHMIYYILQLACLAFTFIPLSKKTQDKLMEAYRLKREVEVMLEDNMKSSKVLDEAIQNLNGNLS